jgi:hypothetical protein
VADIGPFENEDQALATPEAARMRAAFDANPGPGAGDAGRLKVITSACETAGVTLGAYELRFLQWISQWETAQAVALAGIIRRAAQPGARLVEEALHLLQNGKYAPGGTENWRDWERKAEAYLLSQLPAPHHTTAAPEGDMP